MYKERWDVSFATICCLLMPSSGIQQEKITLKHSRSDNNFEEGTGEEIGDGRRENGTMDVRSYEAGQDKK